MTVLGSVVLIILILWRTFYQTIGLFISSTIGRSADWSDNVKLYDHEVKNSNVHGFILLFENYG